ncbi:hypothetical protein PC9H_001103 [Pleurotus ostreatus]|uniref:Uncharacterized protein n=1 Tax=Pleurotus ostreatus TaxID=5322 RepID=A0A8H7A291_PLEOS|nr:uncharacterized protein PC9H_001103 [Pleurotus ostreatus]KAF7440755.1 hypothetical protein PC9H_001103 [Pleurotus ostreatus]
MSALSKILEKLLKTARSSNKVKPAEKEKLQDVKTRLNLLELSSPSSQIIDMICSVLREPLIPMYIAFPEITLELCLQAFLSISKKIAVLKDHTDSRALQWQGAQRSLLSGVLDFLEERRTEKNKSVIAKVLYSTLCSTFFPKAAPKQETTQTATNLLSTVFLLLSESAASHPGNQSDLRDDKNLGGVRLGHMLFRMRDYLALESLLNLFATLLPPYKSAAKRSQFIESVFETASPTHISCGKELTDMVQKSPLSEWEITSARIIETLAKNDIAFPQPFQVPKILTCGVSFSQPNATDRLYLDTRSFFANVDKGDAYETFQTLYNHVSMLNVVPSKDATFQHVTVHLTSPPIVGVSTMRPSDPGTLLLRFDVQTSDLERFMKTVQARNLRIKEKTVTVKSSLCESTSLDFDSLGKPYREPSAKEKIETIGRIFDETRDSLFASDFPDAPPNDTISALEPECPNDVDLASPITTVDPRQICQTVTTPKRNKMAGPVPITKSPLYESVFGTSDNELSELSEVEVLPKGTRTRPQKGDNTKQLPQSSKTARRGKARKIVQSDAGSVDIAPRRPDTLGEGSKTQLHSKATANPFGSICVPRNEDLSIVEASRPNEFSEKPGAARGAGPTGLAVVEPKRTRGRPREVATEAQPVKQDLDRTAPEKHDPRRGTRKRPIDDHDEDGSPPGRAIKRRHLEHANGDAMVRKPSARTAAMLESPKKAAPLARRYHRKDRISSPAIVDSSDPVVDFDDVPHSAVKETIHNGRRRVSLMKKKDVKKVQRKPVAIQKKTDPATYEVQDEDDQVPAKVGGNPKQERNRKLVNDENERPSDTSDNKEVPLPLPPTPPAPKPSKARKAPWQEPSFLKELPKNLPETGPPEHDFTLEAPMTSEAAFESGPMSMQGNEYSVPVQSTSEDAPASDDTTYVPPTIDLTIDSPIRPALAVRNITKGRSKQGAGDLEGVNPAAIWTKATKPDANAALKNTRCQPSETPRIEVEPQNQVKTVTFEAAPNQISTTTYEHNDSSGMEDAVFKPTTISSAIPRSRQQPAQTRSSYPEEATGIQKSAQFIPQDKSPAFLFQHDNNAQGKRFSHSPAPTRNGSVISSWSQPLVTEQKAGFNFKSRRDKPYMRDDTRANQDAMEDIVATLKEIHEVIVQRVYERFDGVTKEVVIELSNEFLRSPRVIHFNNIVGLEEEYSEYRRQLTDGLSEVKRGYETMDQQLGQILRDHDKFSLSKKFPTSLFARSGGPPKLIL